MLEVMDRLSGEAFKGTYKRSLRAVPLDGMVRPHAAILQRRKQASSLNEIEISKANFSHLLIWVW
ncbi:hypothetical protein [Methylomonas fluvii]|nr:hypothetical protein [Methylomonas fluvii]